MFRIEGGINFYEELYKGLDDDDNIDSNNEGSCEECLITNLPLQEDYVTLSCNHKFNYDAIFQDIYQHKKKYVFMENKLFRTKQIRCPYCRNIQNELLPYIQGKRKVHGVNYFDETMESCNKYAMNYNYKIGR